MKKQLGFAVLTAVCLLTSCTQTPDNITNNNHISDEQKNVSYVSVEHILDDFDEAYEQKYTKFSLPKKSSVIINQPEEIDNLELKVINSDNNMAWKQEKVKQLAKILNISTNADVQLKNDSAYIETDKDMVAMDFFSTPYYCLNGDWEVLEKSEKAIYLNRMKQDNLDKKYKEIIDKSVKISDETTKVLEGCLYNRPADLYIENDNGKKFYELSMQPYYKGMGIQNIEPTYSNEGDISGDNVVFASGFDIRLLYNSDLDLYCFVSGENYTPVKSETIDKIISFKSACDILERDLAPNYSVDFDDVKLWYEPRGQMSDESNPYDKVGNLPIKCTPKWYFIVDEESDKFHSISYITVDCVTGDIQVYM
ncbi:MAG: hypothetical protein ACI4RC_06100 [Oscillospiraceae bacterium]